MGSSFLAGPPATVRGNLKDVVADHLRELMFSGQLKPGEKIDQDEIAARLQVSKLPVREALILLEGEGLVRSVPRRGSFVATLTRDDIRDHYRIYALVSGIAAERSAVTIDTEQLDELSKLLDRLESESDPRSQDELNDRFHGSINRAGGTLRLLSAIHGLSRTMPSRFFELASGWAEVAAVEHRRIMNALVDRDPIGAREAMVAHLVSGGEYAVQMLDRQGFFAEPGDG